MKRNEHRITSSDVPVVFCDGTSVYNKLAEKYILHKKGYFILAPSGAGKTFFVNNQDEHHWIDGDVLWPITGADYTDDEWGSEVEEVLEVNARSDVITEQAKKKGFWVIGSSNMYLQPDAVVIPDWTTHLRYIGKRQDDRSGFDGGATREDTEGVKQHIKWIRSTWSSDKVPYFKTVNDAANYIKNIYEQKPDEA